MIRLLIAAPSEEVRAGLETLASSSPEIRVSGAFPDLSSGEDLPLDAILAALPLGEVSSPETPVVLLGGDTQPVWSEEAFRAGVRALLPRDASQEEILASIEAVANGLAVISPQDLEAMLASPHGQAPVEKSELTMRELEVLRMLAEGAANKIIAWKLGISEHTVKFHVASIMAKLGAASRTEAVTMGFRQGLVLL